MPQNAAGIRNEPPPSEPSDIGTVPAATAAADPALDPPAVRVTSHGLRVTPYNGELDEAFQPVSGVVFLPTMMAPAASIRCTAGEVSDDRGEFSYSLLPRRVR